jgi:hypothetical protein
VTHASFKGSHTLSVRLQTGFYKLTVEGGNMPFQLTIQADKVFKEPRQGIDRDHLVRGQLLNSKAQLAK